MPGDLTGTVGSTAALRVAVRRHPRAGADLHPSGLGAGAMAFTVSCRPGLARHFRRGSSHHRPLGAGVGTDAAENPKANLEIPDHGPAKRWPAQLCIGSAAVLGDSRVASRRTRRSNTRSSSIVIRMSRAGFGAGSATQELSLARIEMPVAATPTNTSLHKGCFRVLHTLARAVPH